MLFLMLSLACGPADDTPTEYPPVLVQALQAGAADGHLELPIGVPLGCYTARCNCLGSFSRQDRRQGPYNTGFDESTGIHTRPTIKAIWIESGGSDLVMVKWDSCMSNDNMVAAVTGYLQEWTGRDMQGRVTLSTSHTHSGYGGYNDQWHWFLGTDRYNEEVFQRTAKQLAEVALEAWNARDAAKMGIGWAFDWDPNNKVYSDRRGDNNDSEFFDPSEGWENGKDPHLAVMRIDDMADKPIAMVAVFGIHGIIKDADNPMVSTDSVGGLEAALEESFDSPVVVMYLQGSGGDSSPRGSDREWARMETIGAYATDAIMDLYASVPVSDEALSIEVASRHIWEHRDQIHVTRNGEVDWYYPPYEDPIRWHADDIIYNDDGSLATPFDEFNTLNGAAFCGEKIPLIPGFGVASEVFPYSGCVLVGGMGAFISAAMGYELEDLELPFKEDYKAGTTAVRLGPVVTLTEDGETVSRDLFMGFFPGEPTAMYAEHYRRRVKAELGYDHPLMIGYSQDHEGYLMIPEDWMLGGYEPGIAIWGPLQGEHIMEGVLDMSAELLGNGVHDNPDPTGYYAMPVYEEHPLPTHASVTTDTDGNPIPLFPDHTPDAGTRLTEEPEAYWRPDVVQIEVDDVVVPANLAPFPATVSRLETVLEFGWIGGDPMVDPPHVFLEREVNGTWERALSHSGRPITEAMADILVGYTPFPLYPHNLEQTHQYYAAWQSVGHVQDRAGMPLGNYRFKVEGQHYTGNSETYPWESEPYELATEAFELVPATLHIERDAGGLWVWFQPPTNGYRLIDIDGHSQGANPVRGTITVQLDDGTDQGPTIEVDVTDIANGKAMVPVDLAGFIGVTVTDAYGNTGTVAL